MKSKGLCITCKHKKTCVHVQDEKNPIFHCDEYELITTKTNQAQTNEIEDKEELSQTEYSGICINCDNRMDCKIRCKTSVIWHCEKYI